MRDIDSDELCYVNRFNPAFSPQSRLHEGVQAYLRRREILEYLRRRGRRVMAYPKGKRGVEIKSRYIFDHEDKLTWTHHSGLRSATVTVDHGDGTCDLLYDDGDKDHRLNIEFMTPLKLMEDPKVCAREGRH